MSSEQPIFVPQSGKAVRAQTNLKEELADSDIVLATITIVGNGASAGGYLHHQLCRPFVQHGQKPDRTLQFI
jgi:hypothetical protein